MLFMTLGQGGSRFYLPEADKPPNVGIWDACLICNVDFQSQEVVDSTVCWCFFWKFGMKCDTWNMKSIDLDVFVLFIFWIVELNSDNNKNVRWISRTPDCFCVILNWDSFES